MKGKTKEDGALFNCRNCKLGVGKLTRIECSKWEDDHWKAECQNCGKSFISNNKHFTILQWNGSV